MHLSALPCTIFIPDEHMVLVDTSTRRCANNPSLCLCPNRMLSPIYAAQPGEVTWLRQQFERAANDIAYPRASKATQVADRVGATAAEADEIAHARYQHQRLHNLHQRFATALTNSLEGIREHAKAMRDTMLF